MFKIPQQFGKWIPLFTFILFSFSVTGCSNEPPVATSPQVNITQYMGKWYEIASLPNKFQKDCNCRMTDYEYNGSNVSINHSCLLAMPNGPIWIKATGAGNVLPYTGNAKWEVQMGQKLKGDYYIIFVSNDYQFAVVGTPSRKNLWILARSPVITQAQYNALTSIAAAQLYNINNLQIVDQSCYSPQTPIPQSSAPQNAIPQNQTPQTPSGDMTST